MPELTKVWMTKDGAAFEHEGSAICHEIKCEVAKAIKAGAGHTMSDKDIEAAADAILINHERIRLLLGRLK